MRKLIIAGLIAAFAWGGAAAAQTPNPRHGALPGGQERYYDLTKEATFNGTVTRVKTEKRGRIGMVVLGVKIGGDLFLVRVGPVRWVEQQKVVFAQGDAVTILGETFTSQHGPRIRAREITRGGDKLTIRDQDGNLRWVMPRRSEE